MKKLYSLFLLITGLICITSCGEDDYTYTAPEALDITKADLYFKSPGGTGSIEIKTDGKLAATASVDWCTVNVSGNTITATTIENPSIESRAGTITVSDGTLTSLIAVYQEGLAYTIDTSNLKTANSNSAGSTFIIVNSSSPFKVTIPQNATSWLSYTKDDKGKVTFTFTDNTTGALRGACVIIQSGSKKVPLTIAQYEMDDLIGNWRAIYFDGEEYYQENITISKSNDKLLLNFNSLAPGMTSIFPCIFNDGVLKVQAGAAQGRFQTYYLYNTIFSADNNSSWSTAQTYSGSAEITTDGTFTLKFNDNGSWPNKEIKGIALGAFSSTTLSSTTYKGYLTLYLDIVLYKLP